MNNARYLRELDFARADFYERTNLYREICSQGSGVVQGAATIRYRRFLKPLSIFKVISKVRKLKNFPVSWFFNFFFSVFSRQFLSSELYIPLQHCQQRRVARVARLRLPGITKSSLAFAESSYPFHFASFGLSAILSSGALHFLLTCLARFYIYVYVHTHIYI